MPHPLVQKLREKLHPIWVEEFARVFNDAMDKFNERAPSYDNVAPIWERMDTLEQYATVVKMKALRVFSEVQAEGPQAIDDNNILDLIVWAAMMLAFKRFTERAQ